MSTAIHYRKYAPFADEKGSVHNRLSVIQSEIDGGKYEDAIAHCSELLDLAIQGLRYLQTYDWLFLRALITLGYLGWIAYALTTVVDFHVLHASSMAERTLSTVTFFSSLLVLLYSFFIVQKSPWTYYAYGVFPVYFWEEVFSQRRALITGSKILFEHIRGASGYSSFAIQLAVFVLVLEALVSSLPLGKISYTNCLQVQSYVHRTIFTACYIIGSVWPAFYGGTFVKKNALLIISWATGCLVLSTFTLLPVIKVE